MKEKIPFKELCLWSFSFRMQIKWVLVSLVEKKRKRICLWNIINLLMSRRFGYSWLKPVTYVVILFPKKPTGAASSHPKVTSVSSLAARAGGPQALWLLKVHPSVPPIFFPVLPASHASASAVSIIHNYEPIIQNCHRQSQSLPGVSLIWGSCTPRSGDNVH